MKTDQFNIIISDKGRMVTQGKAFQEFLDRNKSKRGVLSISIYDDREKGSIIGRFNKYIVPEFQKAYFQHSGSRIDIYTSKKILLRMSGITRGLDDINSLDVTDIWLFLDDITKQIAENYNYYIS